MAILFADPPDWTEGDPDWYGAYEFPATLSGGIILSDGVNLAEEGDMFGAFDDDGNVRGIAVQHIPEFGPHIGEIIYEMTLRSNAAGDIFFHLNIMMHHRMLYSILPRPMNLSLMTSWVAL